MSEPSLRIRLIVPRHNYNINHDKKLQVPLLNCRDGLILIITNWLPVEDLSSFSKTNHRINNICRALLYKLKINAGLLFAVWKGNESLVRRMVKRGADINVKDNSNYQRTPLQWAASRGDESIAGFLLESGAKTELISPSRGLEKPALHLAVAGGYGSMVDLLLRNGANIEATCCKEEDLDQKYTALHWAARSGNESMVRQLLKNGAKVDGNTRDHSSVTPLITATEYGNDKISQTLLNHGADVNFLGPDGQSALAFEVINKNIERVQSLLGLGVDVQKLESLGFPPLVLAILEGASLRMITLLLGHGCNVNAMDGWVKEGMTPLIAAIKRENKPVANLLLDMGANIDGGYNYGTSLQYATKKDKYDMVKLLLDRGASTEVVSGPTPLYSAVMNENVLIARLLLANGANIEARPDIKIRKVHCYSDRTPLHCASMEDLDCMVELLLEEGADVNAETDDGMTALHMAAMNGNIPISKLLLSKGANINAKYDDGITPLHSATENDIYDMVSFLIERRAYVNSRTTSGRSALHEAVDNENLEIAQLLIKNGAEFKWEAGQQWATSRNRPFLLRLYFRSGARRDSGRNNTIS